MPTLKKYNCYCPVGNLRRMKLSRLLFTLSHPGAQLHGGIVHIGRETLKWRCLGLCIPGKHWYLLSLLVTGLIVSPESEETLVSRFFS